MAEEAHANKSLISALLRSLELYFSASSRLALIDGQVYEFIKEEKDFVFLIKTTEDCF